MIIKAKYLRDWEESSFTSITAQQKRIILERFGTEPEPYEWTEEDICIQIQNYLSCGEFVKSVQDTSKRFTLPPGVEF